MTLLWVALIAIVFGFAGRAISNSYHSGWVAACAGLAVIELLLR